MRTASEISFRAYCIKLMFLSGLSNITQQFKVIITLLFTNLNFKLMAQGQNIPHLIAVIRNGVCSHITFYPLTETVILLYTLQLHNSDFWDPEPLISFTFGGCVFISQLGYGT